MKKDDWGLYDRYGSNGFGKDWSIIWLFITLMSKSTCTSEGFTIQFLSCLKKVGFKYF